VRRACDIQAHLAGSGGRGACCNKGDHVCLADAVSDGSVLVMIVLEAEFIRAAGTEGNGVGESYKAGNDGA